MSRCEGRGCSIMLGGAVALMLATSIGCSKPCESDDARCDGKSLQTCGQPCSECDREWLAPQACAGACITESELRAFCSLTEEPDPLCANRPGYCDNDLQIRCRSGYPVARDRCELVPGVPGKAECVELPRGLACSATGTIPPRDGGARD